MTITQHHASLSQGQALRGLGCTDAECDRVLARCGSLPARWFRPGQVLMREGEPADFAFIILSGKALVSRMGPDGQARRVAELRHGDIVGEMGLMSGGRRSATVSAEGEVKTLLIDRADFDFLYAESPGFRDRLDAMLRRRRESQHQHRRHYRWIAPQSRSPNHHWTAR